jgi:hypothetical protein
MKFICVALAAALAGCTPGSPTPGAPANPKPPTKASPAAASPLLPAGHLWTGELALQGQRLRFQLETRLEDGRVAAYLIMRGLSTTTHLRCPGLAVVGDSVYIRMPVAEPDQLLVQRGPEEFRPSFDDKSLVLGRAGKNQWRGAWVNYLNRERVPLVVRECIEADYTDIYAYKGFLGRWRITLRQGSQANVGTAVFTMGDRTNPSFANARGALLTELGSFATLSGRYDANECLTLSSFDGNEALLLAASVKNWREYYTRRRRGSRAVRHYIPASMVGDLYIGRTTHYTFTAQQEVWRD